LICWLNMSGSCLVALSNNTYMHIRSYTNSHTHTQIHTHVHTHKFTHTHAHMDTHTHAHTPQVLLRQAALTTTLELSSTICNALTTSAPPPATHTDSHAPQATPLPAATVGQGEGSRGDGSAEAASTTNSTSLSNAHLQHAAQQQALLAALNVLLPWLASHPHLLMHTQGTATSSAADGQPHTHASGSGAGGSCTAIVATGEWCGEWGGSMGD